MERNSIREADFHILLNILLKYTEFLTQAGIFFYNLERRKDKVVEGVKAKKNKFKTYFPYTSRLSLSNISHLITKRGHSNFQVQPHLNSIKWHPDWVLLIFRSHQT